MTSIETVRRYALTLSISKLHIRHNTLHFLKLKIEQTAIFISSLDSETRC